MKYLKKNLLKEIKYVKFTSLEKMVCESLSWKSITYFCTKLFDFEVDKFTDFKNNSNEKTV